MSPDRNPPLIPLFGQNVRHSSVPAKSCSAIARGGVHDILTLDAMTARLCGMARATRRERG